MLPRWLTPGRCCVNCPHCRCAAALGSMGGCGPRQWQVDIAGLTNGTCGSCDDLNGSYVLDWTGVDQWGNCTWAYDFPAAVCQVTRMVLWLSPALIYSGGAHWPIAVFLTGVNDYTYFWADKQYDDRLDCTHLAAESLGALMRYNNTLCTVAGSSLAVTALRPCGEA